MTGFDLQGCLTFSFTGICMMGCENEWLNINSFVSLASAKNGEKYNSRIRGAVNVIQKYHRLPVPVVANNKMNHCGRSTKEDTLLVLMRWASGLHGPMIFYRGWQQYKHSEVQTLWNNNFALFFENSKMWVEMCETEINEWKAAWMQYYRSQMCHITPTYSKPKNRPLVTMMRVQVR